MGGAVSTAAVSITDRPAFARVELGALSVLIAFAIFSFGSLAFLVIGGRHQADSHGNVQDVLVLFLAWTVGSAWLGATLGLAAPWLRRLPVALIVGPPAVFPIMVGFIAADANGFAHWTEHQTNVSIVVSLIVGAFVGFVLWKRLRSLPRGLPSQN